MMQPAAKTNPVKEGSEGKKQQTHEFQCIAQLKVWLSIVCHSHERHVEHDLGIKPTGFDGKFSHDNTGDHT